MAQSTITKGYKTKSTVTGLVSLLMMSIPLIVYMVKAFTEGEPQEKFTLGMSITVSLILVLLNVAFKLRLRSILWVLVLGINACIENIQTLLIIMAVTTIIDEFVLVPLHKYYKQRATINGEIDKRIP